MQKCESKIESLFGKMNLPLFLSGALERAARERKEAAHLVRKSWRSAHVDCSAKYNWNVVSVFRELAVMLDMIANGQVIGQAQPQPKKKKYFVF